jgi:hypothetical protein
MNPSKCKLRDHHLLLPYERTKSDRLHCRANHTLLKGDSSDPENYPGIQLEQPKNLMAWIRSQLFGFSHRSDGSQRLAITFAHE